MNSKDVAQLVPYMWRNEQGSEPHTALVRVFQFPDGVRVLVGRDVSERDALVSLVRRSLVLTAGLMVALGLIAWTFVSRRVLKRIDAIAETSNRFVAGDLSGRLEVTGTGDEFDRLAESLNAMLARIERLMLGLKQVSDNIAHDLKTPLTRMRNRVERALTMGHSEPDYREALHATIDEADQLIRTFNALLLIARAEAGSSDAEFATFDASDVARDVVELYEPARRRGGRRAQAPGMHADYGAGAPGIGQPGACESRRQCRQICRRGQQNAGGGHLGRGEERNGRVPRRRQRRGHRRGRQGAGDGALRAARGEPFQAGRGARLEPCFGGGAAARR